MANVATEAVKILAICIVTVFVCLSVKNTAPAFAVYAAIGGGVIVMLYLASGISKITEAAEIAAENAGISGDVFNFTVKGVGLSWLTGFTADTARDAGEPGIAKKAEFAGKISVLLLCLPIMESIFSDITEIFSGF